MYIVTHITIIISLCRPFKMFTWHPTYLKKIAPCDISHHNIYGMCVVEEGLGVHNVYSSRVSSVPAIINSEEGYPPDL